MPKWGLEMQQGTIVAWHASPGQRVDKGAVLIDVETDKIVSSIEAPAAGVLLRAVGETGATLPVGDLIAVVGPEESSDEEVDSFVKSVSVQMSRTLQADRKVILSMAGTSGQTAAGATRMGPASSAHAERRAAELDISLAGITGSGRNGRISVADVEAAHARRKPGPDRSGLIQQRAATRLVQIAREIPHFRVSVDLDVTRLDDLRRKLSSPTRRVTLTHCLVKATGMALAAHPRINATFVDGSLKAASRPDVALVVSTALGLFVPVIRDAGRKNLLEIASETAGLADRARNNQLSHDEITGGSFTISNLGMFGVKSFDAIINVPQVAVLALGAALEQPTRDPREFRCRRIMSATLSCDHRAINGVDAASFLATLRQTVDACEDFASNSGGG